MRWRLAWLGAILSGCVLGAQPSTTVTAIWDLDPSHDAPGLTWELERDGVIHPCGSVTVTATERRCSASVPALAGVYRLRGVTSAGEPGPWSGEGSGTQTAPGQFVITWHSPITLTEPEPSMAVAHDGEANLTGRAASSTTWTLSGKTTAGSDRVGILRFMAGQTPSAAPTWGGVSMTLIGTVARGSATIRAYYIVAPATASSDIVITFPGPASGPYAVTSYIGVDQTTPVDTGSVATNTGTGTTPTVDVSSAADNLVLDAMDIAQVISSVGADQTAEFLDTAGGSERFGASREAGAATVTMSWTAGSAAWSILAFELNAASAGGADADGALNAPAPTLAASVTVARTVSGALTVPPAVLAASSSVARSASGALVVPPSTLAAAVAVDRSASVAMNIGMPSLAATSTVGRSASGALGLPATTLSATITIAREVAGALVVAPLSLAATVESGRTASGALTLPPPTLSAAAARVVDVDGALTLPVPTLTAAVSVARFASGELALAVPVLAASVETEALTVSAALVLPMPVLDADAMVSRTASGALTLAMPVLDGDAIRAVQVDGVLLLRGLTTDATAAIARLASGDLDAPALMAQANAIIGALQPVLLTRADVVSLVPSRDVLSLMPVRTVEAL